MPFTIKKGEVVELECEHTVKEKKEALWPFFLE